MYNLVRNGSIVDLKNQGGDENQYYFNGKIYRKDAPGNIIYGYLGKVLVLHMNYY